MEDAAAHHHCFCIKMSTEKNTEEHISCKASDPVFTVLNSTGSVDTVLHAAISAMRPTAQTALLEINEKKPCCAHCGTGFA